MRREKPGGHLGLWEGVATTSAGGISKAQGDGSTGILEGLQRVLGSFLLLVHLEVHPRLCPCGLCEADSALARVWSRDSGPCSLEHHIPMA